MGCCYSTPKTPNEDPNHQNGLKIQQFPETKPNSTNEIDHRAPSLPVEEETVKEVLSETPISQPQVSILEEERKTQMGAIEPRVEKFEAKPKGMVEKAEEVSEVSQLSEICSISESFSTTTTTTTIAEKREDEATSKRLNRPPSINAPRKRTYAVDSIGGRERRAKSPAKEARRPEPSLEKEKKIRGSARSVRGRESGQVATRKINVGPAGIRWDRGEGSGRRSRSPSTRPVSASGGRRQLKPPAKGMEENCGSEKVGDKNEEVPQEYMETLDNPHVSLECFIFL